MTIPLPKLPDPDCRLPMDGPPRYRADQMHTYAAEVSAADNARLRAEIVSTNERWEKSHQIALAIQDERDALREQMERQKNEWLSWEGKRRGLELDAERYRWLREQPIDGAPGVPVVAMPNGMRSGYYLNHETADYAIDAARKATT